MISASTWDLQSAPEMTHNSLSTCWYASSPLTSILHSAPPSVCGQISRLQRLDMGHLTDNSIIHKTRVTLCVSPLAAIFIKGQTDFTCICSIYNRNRNLGWAWWSISLIEKTYFCYYSLWSFTAKFLALFFLEEKNAKEWPTFCVYGN